MKIGLQNNGNRKVWALEGVSGGGSPPRLRRGGSGGPPGPSKKDQKNKIKVWTFWNCMKSKFRYTYACRLIIAQALFRYWLGYYNVYMRCFWNFLFLYGREYVRTKCSSVAV